MLTLRLAIMGQRMQEMGPEMKRINELYKDDLTKRGQEMQALYKVLLRILVGINNPDLSALPTELAEAVQTMLNQLQQ